MYDHIISVSTVSDSLTGSVVSLAVLLFISLTINIVFTVHCIYQLRVRRGSSSDGDKRSEELYEQVDDSRPLQTTGEVVTLQKNEAYGEISSINPTTEPNTAL